MSTNEKIAELLLEQTYAERMEMAQWLRDVANDWLAENHVSTDILTTDDEFAAWLHSMGMSFCEQKERTE